jgi:hypothetical protein
MYNSMHFLRPIFYYVFYKTRENIERENIEKEKNIKYKI